MFLIDQNHKKNRKLHACCGCTPLSGKKGARKYFWKKTTSDEKNEYHSSMYAHTVPCIFSRKTLALNDASQRDKVMFLRQLECASPHPGSKLSSWKRKMTHKYVSNDNNKFQRHA